MAGILLSSRSITKLKVVASSVTPKDSSSSSPSLPNQPPNIINIKPNKLPKTDYRKKQNQQKQQPILEIERAIGAGVFRDRDVNSGAEEERPNNMFDNIIRNSVGKNEGSVEKKLRETGEWLIQQTDTTSRSAGKQILTTVFVWLIPMWIAAFLVASGIVELPFHTPFLDDLLF